MALQVAGAFGDGHQLTGDVLADTRLMRNNFRLNLMLWVIKIQSTKTLLSRLFQILHEALIARIVRDHQLKIGVCMDQLPLLFQRQNPAVIGQRMNDHGGILTGLHDLVQVADGAQTRRHGQRTILPAGALRIEQETSDQIGGRHIFITRHGDQRFTQLIGHVFHETGLAATRRALEHHWHANAVSGFIQFYFITGSPVVGCFFNMVFGQLVAHEMILLGQYRTGKHGT
jgi:hypothetical protein